MPRHWIVVVCLGTVIALTAPAAAQVGADASVRSIDIGAGRLADALTGLATKTGVSLLFSSLVVGERKNASIRGRMTIGDALRRLLAGSGLGFRQTADGSIVIYVLAEPPGDETIPEILVVGRRTQNVDIRRTENDIQPYGVATAAEIATSHADDLDTFLRTRMSSDAQQQTAAQNSNNEYGGGRSEINLHGLGADQTLVLIDGARMPGIPSQNFALTLLQPDLNALPLGQIDRVESLTATAGGIYGPGATGGVVNVVLKRDYRGADVSVSYGLTDRSDAVRRRIDGRIGFTPDGGRTDVMIALARSDSGALAAGDRDYVQRARTILLARNPLDDQVIFGLAPNAVVVRNTDNVNLQLKAGDGSMLSSTFTYLPIASSGGNPLAQLVANAGMFPNDLSPDGNGTGRTLISSATTTSILINVRHHFSTTAEAFVDLIRLGNDGRAVIGALFHDGFVSSLAPTSPFAQFVDVSFPLPGFDTVARNRLTSARLSAGLILHLPRGWRAEADLQVGGTRDRISSSGFALNQDAQAALGLNVPGAGGEPPLNPFGDWKSFVTALQQYKAAEGASFVLRNDFHDASFRLAGPIMSRKAGTVTLSLLSEYRRESVPPYQYSITDAGTTTTAIHPAFSQNTLSFYGELRAPIRQRDIGPWPIRGLELQAAVRYDSIREAIPQGFDENIGGHQTIAARQGAAVYTVGLRLFPSSKLMLRSSVSTGELPPAPDQLSSSSVTISIPFANDPKRPGQQIGGEAPFSLLVGGSPHLRPERARTLSVGLVLNPERIHNSPRISIDFAHLTKTDEIANPYAGNVDYFLANEKLYAGRVVRASLSATDAAAGFSGGVVTQVDTSALNSGRALSDSVDVRLDEEVHALGGIVKLYGLATWEPRLQRRSAPALPATDYVGYLDGPLEWRGNAGVDWRSARFSIGIEAQYYGSYHAAYAAQEPADPAALAALALSGVRIPPQIYFDLAASYRIDFASLTGFARSLDIRFGLQDIFDKAPPVATNSPLGYSYYGDPRRRRFELTMVAHR